MNQACLVSRREVLRMGGLSLLLGPWSRSAESPPGSFNFIVVNDTHYVDEMCRPWQTAAAAAMRESAPDASFCTIVGDIADRGDVEALTAMKQIYEKVADGLYTVPGNHDYAANGDRSGYDAAFPDRLNYSFEHQGWQFICLDSTEGTKFEGTSVSGNTLSWLEEEAARKRAPLPTFVFTHFPMGEKTKYRPQNADTVIERLAKFNVKWIHTGHWHGESVRNAGKLVASTSRCCARSRGNHDGSSIKGWHVYYAEEDGTLTRRFVAFRDV